MSTRRPAGLCFACQAPTRFRLSPYVLAEGGALVFSPTSNKLVAGADSQARGAFIYGGGADFLLSKHFSIRAEYRGFVYKAPDFGLSCPQHRCRNSYGAAFGRNCVSLLGPRQITQDIWAGGLESPAFVPGLKSFSRFLLRYGTMNGKTGPWVRIGRGATAENFLSQKDTGVRHCHAFLQLPCVQGRIP